MSTGSKSINMLNGSIWDKMIVFAIPLALTGVLQQLYNMADVAVLGHFVSNEAMAAVGNNVPVNGLIISFCMGLAAWLKCGRRPMPRYERHNSNL